MQDEPTLWSRYLSSDGDAFSPGYHEKPRSEILPLIDWQPRRVLDIGCGGGATGRLLALHHPGCEFFGVERNARAAAVAQTAYLQTAHADLDRQDVRDLGLPLDTIDTVLLLDVLEHLINPWRLLEALRAVLPPGARLVASVPNMANVEALHALASGRWPYARDGLFDITHVRFFTTSGIRELFEQTGFDVCRTEPVPHPASRVPASVAVGADHVETSAVVIKGLTDRSAADLFAQQQLLVAVATSQSGPAMHPLIEHGNVPDAAMKPSATQRLRDAYLDIVRRSVLGLVNEDPALASKGHRRAFDAQAREQGLDWPATAQSMIGHRRMLNVQSLAEQAIVERIPGDFIETGVWRGGACIMMRAVMRAYDVHDRRIWVADSFAGLPPLSPDRYPLDAGDTHFQMPELAVSMTEVQQHFERYGLLDEQVRFLRGWFKDTLPSAPTGPLALMRLDGDMYESTMDALESLFPRLSPGGFVVIDDYGYIESCRAAVDDFRSRHGVTDPLVPIDNFGVYWRNVEANAWHSMRWPCSESGTLMAKTQARRLHAAMLAASSPRQRLTASKVVLLRQAAKEHLKGHYIETPAANWVLENGDLRVVGWAVGLNAPVLWIAVSCEAEVLTRVSVSDARPDVARTYPGSDFSGFSLYVQNRYLRDGGDYYINAVLANGAKVSLACFRLEVAGAMPS